MNGKLFRKAGIGIVGCLVVVIGVILLPLPGPGLLIILGGLLILGTEFVWAQHLVERLKARLKRRP